MIRHGQTDWNVEQRIQGMSDRPLNEIGRSQARLVAEHAGTRFDTSEIWSSDLLRCVQTAEAFGLPFRRAPSLREVDLGDWEGKVWMELQEEFPEMARRYFEADPSFRIPGGELLSDVVERGRRFMEEANLSEAARDVIVVGHGGSLKALIVAMLGLPVRAMSKFYLGNASVTVVEIAPGMIRLNSMNEAGHLGALGLGGHG